MRWAAPSALLPLVVLLLISLNASGNERLPADLRVVATDTYAETVEAGGEAHFVWSFVSVGNASYNLTANATSSSADFRVAVTPLNVTLGPGDLVVLYANVSVPASPRTREATVDVTVGVEDGRHTHLQAVVTVSEPVRLIDLLTAFLGVGAIIFVGFFAGYVFERTKIPDLIWLIALGLFLGPILIAVFGITLVPLSLLKLVTPYFAALALMIILFDGGLHLNLEQVVSRIRISTVHTVVIFAGTVLLIMVIAVAVLGYPFWVGVLLGSILGGTSGAVVIGVVRGLSIAADTKTILILESTITDVLCIVGALTVIGILRGGGTIASALGGLAAAFLVALALGVLAGMFWLRVLRGIQGKPFGFMITMAVLFILYAGTELLGGSGGMAALIFGLILGNHRQISKFLRVEKEFLFDESFKQFDAEISFVVRTFFFVFLGFSFTLPFAATWDVQSPILPFSLLDDTFWLVLVAVLLIFLGILAIRSAGARLTARLHPESAHDRRAMTFMAGRGLAAAVLASLPFAIPAFTDPANTEYAQYHASMAGFETPFLTITFLIILLTVIATTVGVAVDERTRMRPRLSPRTVGFALQEAMSDQPRLARKDLKKQESKAQRDRERLEDDVLKRRD